MSHLHPSRDGVYTDPAMTQAAAATLQLDMGFSAVYDGQTYAQPLYVDNWRPGQDALFIVTQENEVAAFDPTTGAPLWTTSLGAPPAPSDLPCHQVSWQTYGILSTPVIDEASRTLFTEALVILPGPGDAGALLDGALKDDGGGAAAIDGGGATLKHLVFALSIDDGSVRPGWPVDVASVVDGFESFTQHNRGALLIVNGTLYIPYSGIAYDCNPAGVGYHGRVVGISIANPTLVENFAVGGNGGGIWGAVASDGTHIFASSGNTFVPAGDPWSGGEAVYRLGSSLVFTGDASTYFTPSDWRYMDENDLDLGSAGPLLFDVPGAVPSSLLAAMGKQGVVHLLDPSNLGGIGPGDGGRATAGQGLFSAQVVNGLLGGNPATYQTSVGRYIVVRADGTGVACPSGAGNDLVALLVSPTAPPTFSVAWCAVSHGRGSPMVTTTDGQSNPIVWVVSAQGTNQLLGFNADTGELISDGAGFTMSQVLRWTTPIVAKGRMYVGATNQMYAFEIP